jgi:hypothetical protein
LFASRTTAGGDSAPGVCAIVIAGGREFVNA